MPPSLPLTYQHPIILLFVFAFGATTGSFLNVCIFRMPERESVIRPPSRCGSCGTRLGVVDLIPVLSALIFWFRCRHCGHRYSWQYPFVEALTGAYFVLALVTFGPSLRALVTILAGCCLIVIFFIDLRHLIIPNELPAAILLGAFVLDGEYLYQVGWTQGAVRWGEQVAGQAYWVGLPRSVLGMVLGGGLFLFIAWGASLIWRKEAMGGGDIKLAAAMGALLGPGYVFLVYFILSVCLGAVVGIILRLLRLKGGREHIPFGPMMAVVGLVMLLWGDAIAPLIMSLYGAGSGGGGGQV